MPKESVSVSNFDEVRLALRKELGLLSKKFQSSLSAVKVDEISNSTDILKLEQIVEILKTMTKLYDSFAKNMELKPQIHVTTPEINIPEIKVPDIYVPEIRVPAINVPTPQVTVNNEFEVDEIIKALEPLKVLSRNPNSPISVRLSDGKKFIDALTKASEDLSEASSKMGVVFAGGGHSISTIDNSASNPVNVTVVGGGASDGAIVDGDSSSIKATVLDLTSANPLTVAITDANGDQITSFGGGTQYTEGDTDASITGTASMMEGAGNTLLPIQGTVADGLLVNLGSNNDVTVTGTVAVSTINSVAPAFGTGTRGATVQRVTIATDDSVPVTGTFYQATQPVSGTVSVTQATASNLNATAVGTKYNNGGTDDGLNIGVLPAQVGASAPTLNDGRQASLRVTTAGDLAVTLDGEGITGTVTANAGTNLNTSALALESGGNLATIASETTSIDGKITACDTGAVVVSSSALPSGASTLAEQQSQTTHLATIAGDTTSIQTAVELLDNTVAVLGTATYTEATSSGLVIGAVRRDADTTLVNTTNEIAPLQVDANGRLKVEVFSGETLPVSLTSTTVTGTVAVTQSGTWDEVGINDSGNSITVDYATTGSGNATGALRVELPTNGTGVIATVGAVTAITNALPAGTNLIADVSLQPRSDSNGLSVANFTSGDTYTALTNSAQVIKASAGKFYGYYYYNPNSSATYILIYDVAAASVTVGTTTPKLVYCIPATSGANVEISMGIPFTNAGWSIACATTGGGNTAPSVALEVMVYYK